MHTPSWSISASGIIVPLLSLRRFVYLVRVPRHNNLALLQQYGSNAWRTHNYLLEADAKKAEKILEEMKEQTTALNRDRKNSQVCGLHALVCPLLTAHEDASWRAVDIVGESMD